MIEARFFSLSTCMNRVCKQYQRSLFDVKEADIRSGQEAEKYVSFDSFIGSILKRGQRCHPLKILRGCGVTGL